MKAFHIFALFVFSITNVICESLPKVSISDGELQGTIEVARNGRNYYRFLGIPYGKVEKRFEISKPADSWDGVRDASKLGPECLQMDFFLNTVRGKEECLILNVYTPNLKPKKLLPTIFWIHGGAFICGSANDYDGAYFMSENVVLVAINYRLGPLGFLDAGIKGASNNQGLKDQVLALQWVQKNIEAFGGSKDQVTVVGESAGGISVNHLTMSPMAKGLFHAAITQSGMITCPQSRKSEPLEEAKKLANLLDCPISNPQYMVECMRKIKGDELVMKTQFKHPTHFTFDVYEVPQFRPQVETYKPTTIEEKHSVFYEEDPLKILIEGRFNKVPLITGITSHEGIFISANVILNNDTLLALLNDEWGRVAPSTFLYYDTARDPCAFSSKIREFYFQNQPITKENRDQLIDLYSDRWFVQCTRQGALLYARYAPVYVYNLTHWGEQSFDMFKMITNDQGLVAPTHGDDLLYLFPMPDWTTPLNKGSSDERFSEKMVKLWTSFAKSGKPQTWGAVKEWPQVNAEADTETLQWLQLDEDLSVQYEDPHFTKRMNFWDKMVLPIQMKFLGNAKTSKDDLKGTCTKPIDSLIGNC